VCHYCYKNSKTDIILKHYWYRMLRQWYSSEHFSALKKKKKQIYFVQYGATSSFQSRKEAFERILWWWVFWTTYLHSAIHIRVTMRVILTATLDSFFSEDDGGISGTRADSTRVRRFVVRGTPGGNCVWHYILPFLETELQEKSEQFSVRVDCCLQGHNAVLSCR
jgi:hypothetical protein